MFIGLIEPYEDDFLTAQKMRFTVNDFFNKCDQIRSFVRISWHLLKKLLMENFIFCVVPQKIGRTYLFELHIRPYRNVLITSAGDVLKTSIGTSLDVICKIKWASLQDFILGPPHDVIFQLSQDVGRGPSQYVRCRHSLALLSGPYGDVYSTSFRDVIRTPS